MSRAYRISVSESLRRSVTVDDGVCSTLELLPILEKPRMAALLAAELEGKGFVREGDSAKRVEKGGIEVEVNLQSGEVKVSASGHSELSLKANRSAVSENPQNAKREEELRKAARTQLEREAAHEEEALRRKVTEQLEARLKDLHGELDGVVNKVTAAALKTRAAELGTIEEVHEDALTGSLTIKVRV